ncbi:MAG: phage tail tape measure protein [Firmicutes bacterium]|nr:phage tail tape measure protein [Bacillota bacterium]
MSLDTIFKLSVIVGMIDHLTGPMARVNSSVGNSVSSIDRLNQSFGEMSKTGIAMAATGAQITGAVLSPVTATFETKKALGELKSVGVKDLQTLENAAKRFSDTWAGTSKAQFIGAAYDIKSGIASLNDEAVAKYTEIAGITAKGTKATIGEMTSLFATGYGIYKDFYKDMSDIDFGEMFAAGIGHAANIFKTDGPQMAQAISSLGAAATSAKVPMEEQFAILGMLQATMSGSEAGTKYRAFLQSAARAGEELGLKFTDANNQLLSMPEILGLLKSKFGDTMDAAEKMQLQKAFGTDEAVAMIDLMYSKTGELQDGILSVYNSMGKGVSEVREMANAINDTEPDQYQVLRQRIHNVAEEIGNQLLPTVNTMLQRGEVVLNKVSGWIAGNQQLVKVLSLVILTIGLILTGLGILITVVGGVGLVFTKTAQMAGGLISGIRNMRSGFETLRIHAMYAGDAIRSGFSSARTLASSAATGIRNVATSIVSMGRAAAVSGATAVKNFVLSMASMARQAVVTAATAMPGLIASVWSFTAALLANPITWIVIAIIALIAILVLLWQNWDTVVNFLQGAWNSAVTGIANGFNRVREIFASGIQWIRDFITGTLGWFREAGSKILTTFTEGIKSAISAPIEAVKGGLARIRNLLPFSDAQEGPLSTLTLSGRRVFETITSGMVQTQNLPAEATEDAFSRVDLTAQEGFKKVSLKEISKEKSESSESSKEKENATVIERLIIQTDISKLKDLQMLFKLLKEVEDYINSNGNDLTPVGEG